MRAAKEAPPPSTSARRLCSARGWCWSAAEARSSSPDTSAIDAGSSSSRTSTRKAPPRPQANPGPHEVVGDHPRGADRVIGVARPRTTPRRSGQGGGRPAGRGPTPGTATELCALDFDTPFQLLVATILSAQTTDARVNMVTPVLFARDPDPASLAGEDLEARLRPSSVRLGFFRSKAKSLVGMARAPGGAVRGRRAHGHGGPDHPAGRRPARRPTSCAQRRLRAHPVSRSTPTWAGSAVASASPPRRRDPVRVEVRPRRPVARAGRAGDRSVCG